MLRFALCGLLVLVLMFAGPDPTLGREEEHYFTLLYTADEHSHLIPHSPTLGGQGQGGWARLASKVNQIRRDKKEHHEPVILVSAGDFVGGTPFSWLSLQGEAPELSLMLEVGYDVITLGNHEFDYGGEELASYLKSAGYPGRAADCAIVASNLVPDPAHPLNTVGIVPTTVLTLERDLKVGFFGLIGQGALQVTSPVEGVTFTPQDQAATEAVAELKAQGADIIVGITHAGVDEDRALARQVDGIHLIVGGHCHTPLADPLTEGNTLIVQSGALLENLGMLELAYDPATPSSLRVRNTDILLPLGPEVKKDPLLAQRVAHYTEQLSQLLSELTDAAHHDLTAPVAELQFPLTTAYRAESTLGNFVTDALRSTVEEITGDPVTIAVQPNGMLRGTVYPHQGDVSIYDLIWPLSLGHGLDQRPGYPVVSFYLTGEEIRRTLEISLLMSEILGDSGFLQVSGISSRYDPGRTILFWIPFLNQPLPSTRAVLEAHWDDGSPVKRGDSTLYHAVCDYYTATFIPMVGDMLPSLSLTPKDAQGQVIADLRDAIVRIEGEELKVWQAVLRHTSSLTPGPGGLPAIPETYAAVEGRLQVVRTIPLLVWPLAGFLLLIALTIWLFRRIRGKKSPRAL